MANPAPLPWTSSVIQLDAKGQPIPGFTMGKDFGNWLVTSIVSPISNTPQLYPSVVLTAQSAAIGTTPIPLPALASGSYRISYYARITVVDPVSSSLTIHFGWTDDTISIPVVFPAMTGNLITTVQSSVFMILADASSPITYSTDYVSNTPGTMKYKLTVLVESI